MLEFFDSLVIHNLLFEVTADAGQGFIEVEGTLYAVLKQESLIPVAGTIQGRAALSTE